MAKYNQKFWEINYIELDEKHAKSHVVMAFNKFIAYTHVLDRFLFEKDIKTLPDDGFASIKYMYNKQKRIGFRYTYVDSK